MSVRIINGDCLTVLPQLAGEGVQVHAVVCDPPYGLGFMGKKWDAADNVAFRPETWAAVMACMRPGAHLVAFGGTRTWHRMAVAIEDAGFEIRENLAWVFGSGFPKSHNLHGDWEGWGTALKPAFEPIILARKPLIGTVAANVLAHGTGALNIDACRVAMGAEYDPTRVQRQQSNRQTWEGGASSGFSDSHQQPTYSGLGRWPANVLHDGSDEVEAAFAAFGERTSGVLKPEHQTKAGFANPKCYHAGSTLGASGDYAGNTGSASRFFYCAKADASDRVGSKHPTVKPGALMRWLVQLVTPPGGLVLDPFAGTGSTGLAADQIGMDAILIEQDATYAEDARRKVASDGGMFSSVAVEDIRDTNPRSLFAEAE